MSIKMLIVDDEPIICQGLQSTVPWANIGVEVIGEAYDGQEALEFIANNDVDLVLTDICMPEMDGIALTRELKRLKHNIKVIIISGYDEFEYARNAIRLGVEDFLLKPVDVDELMKLVANIFEKTHQEREQERLRVREEGVKWLSSLMQSEAVYAAGAAALLHDVPEAYSLHMIAGQMDRYVQWLDNSTEAARDSFQQRWREQIEGAFEACGVQTVSYFFHRNLLLTFCIGPVNPDSSVFMNLAKEVINNWTGPESIYLGVSSSFQSVDLARHACLEAINVLQFRPLAPEKRIFRAEDSVKRRETVMHRLPQNLEKQLSEALIQGNQQEADVTFELWLAHFRTEGYMLKEVLQAYEQLRMLIYHRWPNDDLKEGFAASTLDLSSVDLHTCNSFEAIERLIREDFGGLSQLAVSLNGNKNHWIIEQTKKYIIEHHYCDIKASDVALSLQITPNYFSLMFKQNAGKNFTEYVNELRIEQAKFLLSHSADRVFEIAEKIGYKEYKYFVSIFKSYTGLTPTDYRKRIIQ
ncbi:response regulator transcription factor [Paenibacillus planticolens]|uniref:Response regulator n=1 Tax=Paenibacillus planticolens TaxID=2654976 RepID=A0ABX1ZG65_9BACL|nr:response regulator [Paenibacillus planticolens]NOU98662.1 response regulator [Paenibacillus planticolens]